MSTRLPGFRTKLSLRMKITLAAITCLTVTAISVGITGWFSSRTVEASMPATSMVTVPSTIGQTVTINWTGSIPPGSSATSNCTALADTPAVDQHNSTLTVPVGVYNTLAAQFTF